MSKHSATLEKEITDALWTLGREVESSSKGQWRCHVGENGKAPVDVRLDDEWLTCQFPVASPSTEDELWRTVERSKSLDGACKVIVEPHDSTFHIRQDIPVTEDADFSRVCRRALEAVISARRRYVKPNGDGEAARQAESVPADDSDNDSKTGGTDPSADASTLIAALKDACVEAGWLWSEREGSRPFVDLDIPEGSRRVDVDAIPGRGCRLSVSLARHKSLPGTCRSAVAVFLLTANAFVRFARAGVEEGEKGVEAFYEVWIDERPTAAVVGHALASLSVGYRLCEKELQVLGNETVARTLLEARGSFLKPGGRSPRKKVPARQG